VCLYAQNMTMHACTCLPPQGVNHAQPVSHLTNRSTLAVKMLSTERADDAAFGVYSHRLGACPRCIASTLRAVMRGTFQQLLRTHTNVHASAPALMPVPSFSPPPLLLHRGTHASPATQRTQETRGWVGSTAYTMHPPPPTQRMQETHGSCSAAANTMQPHPAAQCMQEMHDRQVGTAAYTMHPHPASQRAQETRDKWGAAAYTMHPHPAAQCMQEMHGWWGARPTPAAPCSGSTSRTSSCGS